MTRKTCHVCCEVGTFIVFLFSFFFYMGFSTFMSHALQIALLDHMMYWRDFFFSSNIAADHNLSDLMIYSNVVALPLDKIYIWH